MDETAIRRDCAEAHAMATDALADGVEPPPAQVQRLRDALSGHVRRLVDVVSQEFADAAPGPLRDVVTKTLGLAEGILTHPVRGSVLDLLAMPPVVRLLTLMHEEPEVFGAAPEHPALEGWGTRDAV